ncbi:MAG TPA: hypothetical protein VEK75_17300 [Xanthobacteraceae bacterium]|nr:hypothetical protein [Xanthobacteraceae bacterium]
MTLRSTHFRFAAAALAMAVVSLTGPSARAFTMENLNGSADANSRFADPDEQVKKFGQGSQPFGPGGPTVQFNTQPGYVGPFNRMPGAGFASPQPPQPYARPLGNGD